MLAEAGAEGFRELAGEIGKVTDAEILAAYRELARTEGVFCEPSSAAGVAGLALRARRGFFRGAGGAAAARTASRWARSGSTFRRRRRSVRFIASTTARTSPRIG